MKLIGNFQSRKVFWFDYNQFDLEELPPNDWISFTISDTEPDLEKFEKFANNSIDFGILEFKSQGNFGEKLHLLFDEILVDLEISDQIYFIDIPTTGDNSTTLIEAFWECFFATTLPNRTNFENLSIVCMDLSGTDRSADLTTLLEKFENGWFPED
ncbi:MAG: hypothetical protein PHQ74_09595 [Crocinitomicaceae bacterium]|nr:hypothetical protein [Crocinitomicaceae bacterium]